MKTLLIFSASVLMVLSRPGFAAEDSAEEIAAAQVKLYQDAFNKGDAKALADLYAENAQYSADDGVTLVGREALLENLTKYFAENKTAELTVEIETARLLTQDVLLEKGFATVDGETTRYLCTYVKTGDKWLISELDETTLAPLDAAAVALRDLQWLVGPWKDAADGPMEKSVVEWTNNGHFLRRSFTIRRVDEELTDGSEVIGFDPTSGTLRSWTFDSDGTFGEGRWIREGNKWINSYVSTATDGSVSSAQHIITLIDENTYTWESVNRQRDGEVLPSIEKVEVVRVTKP